MLLSKTVMIRWNGFTRKWYEDKGYTWTKVNEQFECKIEDVQVNSTARISVKCDYGGEEFETEYRRHLSSRKLISKDCCSNRECMVKKSEDTNLIKYGVRNHMQTEESKKHLSEYSRTDFNIIKETFKNKGLKLISTEKDYKNDRSRLKFICSNHEQYGIQETNYANVRSQKHCCGYGGTDAVAEIKRLDDQIVYDDFIKQGLIPQFKVEDYINNNTPMPYICKKHEDKGVQYRQYANLKYTKGCEYCANESRRQSHLLDEEIVFNYFRERGLIVPEDEVYQGKDLLINFICPHHNHEVQQVGYNNLKKTKVPCKFCREENNLHTLSRKVRSALSWWRKASKHNCKNKCILTGLKGNIEIHHQYQLDSIIKEALFNLNIELKLKYTGEEIVKIKEEINRIHKKHCLGICLNQKLHKCFHTNYGKWDCTKEMINEFIKDYFDGKYDDVLDKELKSINSKSNYEEAMKMASFYYVKN